MTTANTLLIDAFRRLMHEQGEVDNLSHIHSANNTKYNEAQATAAMIYALISELGELGRAMGDKPWKAGPDLGKEANRLAVLDEWADCLAFFLKLTNRVARLVCASPGEFVAAWVRCQTKNKRRFTGKVEEYKFTN